MKVLKKFTYDGIEMQVVLREEIYMNAKEPVMIRRVIAPNGGVLPMREWRNQTIKSMVEEAIKALDNFKSMGADIKHECTRPLN